MPVISLLERSDFDFTDLGGGKTIILPIRQALSVEGFATGSLQLRLHTATIPTGARARLDVRVVAPTTDDPAMFFRGPVVATAELNDGTAAPWLSVGASALHADTVGVFLVVTQAPTATTFRFTISADLAVREGIDTWTPQQLSSLTLWLDQRDQVEVGGEVSDWGDQSPSGVNDYMQSVSFARPTVGAAVNAQPAPTFDNGFQEMFVFNSSIADIITATAYHCFAVLRFTALTASDPASYLNHGVIGGYGAFWLLTAQKDGVQAFHWDGAERATPAIQVAVDQDVLIEWSYDGATISCRVNAGVAQTAAAGKVTDLSGSQKMGWPNYAGQPFYGALATVLVCDKYLPPGEVQNVRAYLSTKYGVPA